MIWNTPITKLNWIVRYGLLVAVGFAAGRTFLLPYLEGIV